MGGAYSTEGGQKKCVQGVSGETCGTHTPLGRPNRRWQNIIKMDLQEVGWGAWIGFIWLGIGAGGGRL